MPRFQVGDRVQLKDPKVYLYRDSGHPNLARRVGDRVGIVANDFDDTLNVEWGVSRGAEGKAWGIDADCVVVAGPTEAELDEVYKILGVTHG